MYATETGTDMFSEWYTSDIYAYRPSPRSQGDATTCT